MTMRMASGSQSQPRSRVQSLAPNAARMGAPVRLSAATKSGFANIAGGSAAVAAQAACPAVVAASGALSRKNVA